MQYVKVLINKKVSSLDREFIYEVPPQYIGEITIGSVVSVPFGPRTEKGIVIGYADKPRDFEAKYIDCRLNESFLFPEDLLELADELSRYYLNPTISMLKTMIPRGVNLFGRTLSERTEYRLRLPCFEGEEPFIRGKKQRELFSLLKEKKELSYSEAKEKGFSAEVCNGLVKNGGADKISVPVSRYSYKTLQTEKEELPVLSSEQQKAMDLIASRKAGDHRPILLHGVTGSGKTELYMRLIQNNLDLGKQVIVLLPEIALTPQYIEVFERRFRGKIALFHSRLSDGERRDGWYAMAHGEAQIALGARSCIFAPVKDLGLIIIDEEHEDSYEQENAPRFHARKAAEIRCKKHRADLVLGSATPSFESYQKAESGQYLKITLKERIHQTPLPAMTIVDMREELREGWTEVLSRPLIDAIRDTLDQDQQVILFLNRLGYHTFVSCRDCGFVYRCPNCGISLTYFRDDDQLRCSHCDYREKIEQSCPQCGGRRIKYFGLGIEQLEDVVKRFFPNAAVDRLDSEAVKKKGAIDKVFDRMRRGDTDILIGTRMIAKGWDFSNVALTGIIAADYTLNFPDFRSSEKTFQMIAQVAGRCGREKKQGRVVLQTYCPDEPAIMLGGKQDFDAFYRREKENREMFCYPPFTSMMRILFVTPKGYLSPDRLAEIPFRFRSDRIRVLGPSPAVYGEKDRDKWVLTFLGDDLSSLKMLIKKGISKMESAKIIDKNISVKIETEPIHTV